MSSLYRLFSLLLICFVFSSATAHPLAARTDSTRNWKFTAFTGLTFTQVAFYQWAQGGQNALSFLLDVQGTANFKKGKHSWDNALTAKWGMTAVGYYRKNLKTKFPFKKSDDLFEISTKYGYALTKKLNVSVASTFKSQLSDGYIYFNDTTRADYQQYQENNKAAITHFLAPANVTASIGLDYRPTDYFGLFFSPATAKLIIVRKFGNDPFVLEEKFGVEKGKTVMAQAGAYWKLSFHKDIIKNINYKTQLEVFLTYTDMEGWKKSALKPLENGIIPPFGGPVDIDWQNDLIFRVNKFIQATLSWRILYDHRTLVPVDADFDYVRDPIYKRGIQIRQAFGLTFAYKF